MICMIFYDTIQFIRYVCTIISYNSWALTICPYNVKLFAHDTIHIPLRCETFCTRYDTYHTICIVYHTILTTIVGINSKPLDLLYLFRSLTMGIAHKSIGTYLTQLRLCLDGGRRPERRVISFFFLIFFFFLLESGESFPNIPKFKGKLWFQSLRCVMFYSVHTFKLNIYIYIRYKGV